MRRKVPRSAVVAAAASAIFSVPAWSQSLTAVQTGASNATINLTLIANVNFGSAAAAPIDAATIPGSDKLYIADSVGNATFTSVQALDPVSKTITPFLNFSSTSVPITGQGVQGITFSPNFNDPSSAGYHKFYTYEEETTPGAASVMFKHPEVANPADVGVLREWTANSAGTAIDTGVASRVVLNFGTPAGHMGGGLKFGPDGYLYLSTGDGGGSGDGYSGSFNNAGDSFTGRGTISSSGTFVPAISNGQDFTNVLGKVLRIDPYTTNGNGSARSTPVGEINSTSGSYFIPSSNPFVGDPQNIYFTNLGPVGSATPSAPLNEVFATGFRNPWKLTFDKNAASGALPYVANVGSHAREEIEQVQGGQDYGWPYYEGDIISPTAATFSGTPRPGLTTGQLPFLKKTGSGSLDYAQYDLNASLTDPAQMAKPTAILGTRSVTSSLGGIFTDHPAVSNGTQSTGANDLFSDGAYGDSYGDTNAVTGGFIYRGSAIPSLFGMYVFGGYEYDILDPAKASYYGYKSDGGRLFYFDPTEAAQYKTIKEFNYDANSSFIQQNAGGDLLSVAQADNGDLFGLFANGDVKKLNPNPGWNVDGNGSWSTGANWSGAVPNGVNASTYFGGTITAARTITVDSPQTVGALNFDNIYGYTLAGTSTITMDVSGQTGIRAGINVTTGDHTISAPVVLNDNTVFGVESGTATLFMTGSLTSTGVGIFKEGAGAVQFENIRSGSLTVSQGTARVRARGSPDSTDGVSRVSGLTIASGATLDLQNNAMVIDYSTVGSLVTDLRSDLHSGQLTGTPDVFKRFGYGDNALLLKNSFEGQDVSSHSNVLIKYTYAGDINLDGKVDMTDLQILANHWTQSSTVWTSGDTDYNGVVDVGDLVLLAENWQAGVANPLPASSLTDALLSLGLPTDVPEPAVAALLAMGLSLVLGRRRRRDAGSLSC